MSYFATLATRVTATPVVSSSARSGSPLTMLDQRLGSSSSALSPVDSGATTDPFDAASASMATSAPLGSAGFAAPSAASLDAPFAAGTSSHPSHGAPFDPGQGSQSPIRASIERAPRENAAFAPLPSEPVTPTSPRPRAESLRAELGPTAFTPQPITTSAPKAQEVLPARADGRAEPLERCRTTGASHGEQAPEPASREPSFPAPLREALERVEAWMRRDAKPSPERLPTAERARPEPLERVRPVLRERALHAAEGRIPRREPEAPRLSIGHIEVEVITTTPPSSPPIIWHAPPVSAARSPLAAPTGRVSFGARQR